MMIGLFRHLIGGLFLLCAMSAHAHAYIADTQAPSFNHKRCFANVKTPGEYESRLQIVELQASYTQKRYLPAQIEHQRLRIETKEAAEAFTSTSPVYETVFEQVLVVPERIIEVRHPAKYIHWTETIEIEPETHIWKRCGTKFGPRKARSAINTAGRKKVRANKILCRQAIPARERFVHHTKLVKDAWTELKTIPAQYRTVARQVVKRQSEIIRTFKSPEYTPVSVAHEIAPARYEIETIPAVYREEFRDVLVAGNQLIRAEVLCDRQVTRDQVANIQTALVENGYPIRIDGIYGPETQGAMERYQTEHALSRGYLTVETVNALGIALEACDQANCAPSPVQTTIKATQQALSQVGFPTQSDGIHGPQTQASLEAFQRANGLEVGFLSAETMNALNIITRI